MKDIAKQYPMLTADERFRLFVAAMGRKDEREVDRLEATCPRKHYIADDYEYARKKMRFTVFALLSALELLRTDLLVSLALVAMLAADDDGGGPNATSEKAIDVFKQLMQLRRGKRDGWLQFCSQIGVDPDAMTARFIKGADFATDVAQAVAKTLEADDEDNCTNVAEIAKREYTALVEAWGEPV